MDHHGDPFCKIIVTFICDSIGLYNIVEEDVGECVETHHNMEPYKTICDNICKGIPDCLNNFLIYTE